MKTLIVLFNLKTGCSREEYEHWARSVDIPTVERLESCDGFEVFRTVGTLAGGEAPCAYVEIIRINDFAAFEAAIAGDEMQKVAAEFQAFADSPVFMLSESLVS
ncbi:MAG: EthD family reductase [Pseudohaliea sp.]